MKHLSISDDRLLALEVEMALKALGIACTGDVRAQTDLRSAVEDLRSPQPAILPLHRGSGKAPALQPDDEIFGLK
ncbi:hypothetical protein ASG43_17110 [Aureimonas sp. Leaf454]|nr:hypothetical protein ASG43_17110 [Aureimonas sp. Leaf454]